MFRKLKTLLAAASLLLAGSALASDAKELDRKSVV